jgi:hypothetical protein
MVFGEGGQSVRSVDGGDRFSAVVPARQKSSDIPWLLFTDESYFAMATVQFDPTENGRLWTAQGVSICTATVADDASV